LAPLAIPLRIELADARAADAVAAACRGWAGQAGPGPALVLRIDLSGALVGTGRTVIHVEGAVMRIHGSGVAAEAEFCRGIARCAVSAGYLAAPQALFAEVLEPLVLMMVTQRDRTPVHASAFVINDTAILLAGHTGAGKSCLARAADAAGYQVLSDDTVFVQLAPRLTVWGWPTAAHLLASDAPGRAGPTRLRNGTLKQVVPLRSACETALCCHRAVLCLLTRARDGVATLEPAPASAVEERLWPLDSGFDLLPAQIALALARLSRGGVWDLRLSRDPAEAVRLLARSIARLEGSAAS
ncbi:MAG TPA: hypothetical protein VFS49_06120, partial [Croceibacterium sp.]|nr:hypothetical protein [Croceibacterium sp.]